MGLSVKKIDLHTRLRDKQVSAKKLQVQEFAMRKYMLAVLLLCVFAASIFAQSTTGRLVGTVSGPDGVIPGATIVITDNQTKRERTLTSSDDGAFAAPQLEFGTYTVSVTATGFKTLTATDLKIDIGREYSLNPTLEVGGVNESVTVVAGADIVNAVNGELSGTVSPAQITQLPLDGRSPLSLITLQPGTASSGANGGTTSINGQRTAFTNITRDGINVNDNFIRANGTDFSPERSTSDDTGEFTITTQNAGADQGYGAAQVRLVTPRGQSEFHGALYEYNRNSKFTANAYPNNASDQPRPFLNRNQLGGKIGGPFPVPNFGEGGSAFTKGKGFFFFAYEKQYLRQSQTNTSSVLTSEAKSGNFRFIDSTGVTRSVNIFSLLPAGGAGNSPTGINPIIQSRILAGMPNPNTPGGDLNTSFFSVNQAFNDDYDYYTTRIDLDINDRHTINGVYTYKDQVVQRPDVTLDNFANSAAVVQPGISKFLALAYSATPTDRFNNEVRGGFSFPKANFERITPVPDVFIRTPTINNVPRNNGGLDYVNSPETVFPKPGAFSGELQHPRQRYLYFRQSFFSLLV
ncbi:MAG: carboxypeptidase-like regulatory domain-containing protein [Pyrinomonadaceae bacterium]